MSKSNYKSSYSTNPFIMLNSRREELSKVPRFLNLKVYILFGDSWIVSPTNVQRRGIKCQ